MSHYAVDNRTSTYIQRRKIYQLLHTLNYFYAYPKTQSVFGWRFSNAYPKLIFAYPNAYPKWFQLSYYRPISFRTPPLKHLFCH